MVSGFPKPFMIAQKESYNRWVGSYDQQLIRGDIRNFTNIKQIDQVEMLFHLLSSKVGSPLSIESLIHDLQVALNRVSSWLKVLESFYLVFRLSPWDRCISRAIRKSKKLYFFDYARLEDPGLRFENMVAVELWRAVSTWNDWGRGRFGLYYVRNKEHEEIDFLITRSDKPMLLVEVKLSDDQVSKPLYKFQTQLSVPAIQVVNRPNVYKVFKNGRQEILVITA